MSAKMRIDAILSPSHEEVKKWVLYLVVICCVVEELTARPCRERTADFMQWMHCLAATGRLLENTSTLRSLEGKAIESPELLQFFLLLAVMMTCLLLMMIGVLDYFPDI